MKQLRSLRIGTVTVFVLTLACSGGKDTAVRTAADANEPPQRGGTLRMLALSDVGHLSTISGYTSQIQGFSRLWARQLLTYPPDTSWAKARALVPDVATQVPSLENGGISADGKTYTLHLRAGIQWNAKPPRAVTARDFERTFKLLCNPVSPVGAPGYFRSTIVGMASYCDAFARVKGDVADIRRFVEAHELAGVRVPDDTTIRFTLLQPSVDFPNLLAVPFTSATPEEYLAYVPDGAEFRQHTISNGPYQITRYVGGREIVLERNPAWNPATDPMRGAYPDRIEFKGGVNAASVLTELQAGTADLIYDKLLDAADLILLRGANDPDLHFVPSGDAFLAMDFLSVNLQSPNANRALGNVKVREALQYAVSRYAYVQDRGGRALARPLYQAVFDGVDGYVRGADPHVAPADTGDPVKARALLAEAGFPQGLSLVLAYPIRFYGQAPELLQAAMARSGIRIQMRPYTTSDYWGKVLFDTAAAQRGEWDLALTGWVPDWFERNGRSVISPLFDGRTYGTNSQDYGAYRNAFVNAAIDAALASAHPDSARRHWEDAARQVMRDAAIVPLIQQKLALYHAPRVRNCTLHVFGLNCDYTNVWLKGGAR